MEGFKKRIQYFGMCTLLVCLAHLSLGSQLDAKNLLGVDNIVFSQDSLTLMNSLLIDYQVDYDIAIAVSEPTDVAKSLHKVGLVYYHLDQLDLATNYAWRLLNVASKNDLEVQKMFAFALLCRINEKAGNVQKAQRYLSKYNQILNYVNSNELDFQVESGELNSEESFSETPTQSEIAEKPFADQPVILNNSENEASLFNPNWLWILVAFFGGVWMYLRWSTKEKVSLQEIALPIASVDPVLISVKDDFVIDSKEPVVASPILENEYESEKEEDLIVDIEMKTSVSFNPVIQHEECENPWMIKLQDQVSQFTMDEGCAALFGYSGNFESITEGDYSNGSRFVDSVLQQLAACRNTQNVLVQWLSSAKGFVIIMILSPSNSSLPLIDAISKSQIRNNIDGELGYVYSEESLVKNVLKLSLKKYIE